MEREADHHQDGFERVEREADDRQGRERQLELARRAAAAKAAAHLFR